MQRVENEGTSYEETVLYIVEVYFDDNEGHIIGWTEKEEVWGENLDDIRQSLTWMLEACDKPILNEAELLLKVKEIESVGGDFHDTGTAELNLTWEAPL